MKRELILEEWNRFYAGAFPEPLCSKEAARLKAAFFAGATASLTLLYRGMEEDDFGRLADLQQETKAFATGGN